MQFLPVLFALLLPWLAGTLLLEYCIRRWPQLGDWHWATRCCVGLLAGYALLYLLLVSLAPWSLGRGLFIVLFATACALLAHRVAHRAPRPYAPAASHAALVPPWLAALLCILIGMHAITVTVEALSRPVYPWDAWLAWIYRAKAWFHAGAIAPLADPGTWLNDTTVARYTIDAHNYPRLASVMPYWVAVAAGYWPETLLGIPALLLGAGLVLGLYGLSREAGADRGLAMLIAYFFLSIPLVRTHLSLPGYADIWMVGYAGMGMAFLMQGLWTRHGPRLVLGLALLGTSALVKHEGTLWLYLGIALAVLTLTPPRWLAAACVALAGCVAALALLGGSIALPLLGRIGVAEGQLWIPGLMPQLLAWHDSRQPFLRNALQLDSWHLLWPLLGVLIVRSAGSLVDRRIVIALAFLLLFALTLFGIFFVSAQGSWAATFTAVNRVPLQLLPALLLALLWMVLEVRNAPAAPARLRDHAPAALGALIAICLTLFQLVPMGAAQPGTGEPVSNWRSVVGTVMQLESGAYAVSRYQNGVSLISSGPITALADELPVLEYQFTGAGVAPDFFWRRADDPSQLHTRELFSEGLRRLPLAGVAGWQDTITEAGFILYDTNAQQQTLVSARIYQPASLDRVAQGLASWMEPPLLSQRSINFLSGGPTRKVAYPVSTAGLWLLATLVVALLLGQRRALLTRSLLITGISAWILLDLRWTSFTVGSGLDAAARLATVSAQDHVPATDVANQGIARRVAESLGDDAKRVVILADLEALAYEALRTKYLLLPHAAVTLPRERLASAAAQGDYVLILHLPGAPSPVPQSPTSLQLELLWHDTRATLLRVNRPPHSDPA